MDTVTISFLVPPGWKYEVWDAGNSVQALVGPNDPLEGDADTRIIEEFQIEATTTVTKKKWNEYELWAE